MNYYQELINQAIKDCSDLNNKELTWARLDINEYGISMDIGFLWPNGHRELSHIKRKYYYNINQELKYYDSTLI